MRTVVFVGPSAHGLSPQVLSAEGIERRPPVRREDLARLCATTESPGVVVICDGVFETEPPVSHREIEGAIADGWRVWGVSSMGAIRAHEMRDVGMMGYGYVHALFTRYRDFTDDELCLLHFPEPPYFPVSEALVNLRHALERKGVAFGISPVARRRVLARLRTLWFGDRTEETMSQVLREEAGIDEHAAGLLLAWMRRNRIKTIDLFNLMREKPWLESPRPEPPAQGDRLRPSRRPSV